MRKNFAVLGFLLWAAFLGCATAPANPPADKAPTPLADANLAAVLEENAGLEIAEQDAKDARDLYRAGVQQKALAEKKLAEKDFRGAHKLFDTSNYLFNRLFQYIDTDDSNFVLFEETGILFLPNLLSADNYFKIGDIDRDLGRVGAARRSWKKGLSFARKSLASERTEWGLNLEREIQSRLTHQR